MEKYTPHYDLALIKADVRGLENKLLPKQHATAGKSSI